MPVRDIGAFESPQWGRRSFSVSAPGKVILFGEHAVVYGKLAIASPISLRSTLVVEPIRDGSQCIELEMPDIKFRHNWKIEDVHYAAALLESPSKTDEAELTSSLDSNRIAALMPLLSTVISSAPEGLASPHQLAATAFLYMLSLIVDSHLVPAKYILTSEIPVGAGLGSSSSIATCFSAAMLVQTDAIALPSECRIAEDRQQVMEKINRWAFVGELCMHGHPSGLDNIVATFGHALAFRKPDKEKPFEDKELEISPLGRFPDLPLMIVNSMEGRSTSAEVARVRDAQDEDPPAIDTVLDAIERISSLGLMRMSEYAKENGGELGDKLIHELGRLMKINHALLTALEVSHPRIERIRQIIDGQDVGYTKLTGAGGGGCTISLLKQDIDDFSVEQSKHQLQSEGYQTYTAKLCTGGVAFSETPDISPAEMSYHLFNDTTPFRSRVASTKLNSKPDGTVQRPDSLRWQYWS